MKECPNETKSQEFGILFRGSPKKSLGRAT